MTAKGVKKLMSILAAFVLLFLIGWIGTRWWTFKKEAPIRAGVSALKEGEYSVALAKLMPYADKGHTHAQSVIGTMYAHSLGVPYDEVQASMWFRRSERDGKVTGTEEYGVARWYLEKRDFDKAARWLQRAAEAGHPEAQRTLADDKELIEKGLKIDPAVSEYWRKYASPTRNEK